MCLLCILFDCQQPPRESFQIHLEILTKLSPIICLSNIFLQPFHLPVVGFRIRIFFFRILCERKRLILSKTLSLKLFHISSMQLPFLAHLANLSRRTFCKPKTSVLCYLMSENGSWSSVVGTVTRLRDGQSGV